LINSTSEEFAEYFETIEQGKEKLKKDLFENFKTEYDEYADMQTLRFTRWLKEAAKIKGIRITERKSGSERFILLGESVKVDELDESFFSSEPEGE
jgi:ribosomal protein S18